MPTCFCVVNGCSHGGRDPISDKPTGKVVDPRTYRAHTLADRQAAFHATEQNPEAVLEAQIEEITTHLSASVLADNVSGPSPVPGGSLWSRDPENSQSQDKGSPNSTFQAGRLSSSPISAPHNSPPKHLNSPKSPSSPPRQTGSRRSRESELLASLSCLEEEVNTLHKNTLERLACLGRPSSLGPPTSFPLSDLLQSSRNIQGELDIVMFKGHAVAELKASIVSKLQKIDQKLMTAKKNWNKELSEIKAAKTPVQGVPCETGMTLID